VCEDVHTYVLKDATFTITQGGATSTVSVDYVKIVAVPIVPPADK